MNINATVVGQIAFVFIIIMPFLGYYLGKKKTNSPILVSVIAFFTGFIPPFAILFVLFLVFKKNKPALEPKHV